MKKTLLLVMLAMVVLSGCFSSADQTQYIVTEENGTLRPFGIIEYNMFKDGAVTAKITQYQKEYLNPSHIYPGHMNFRYKKLPVELEKLKHCTVFDKDNFEGDLSFLSVKVVNGKWVSPAFFQCVGFLKWTTEITLSTREYHEWVPGTKHPTKHIIAANEERRWLPEVGYEWILDDNGKVKKGEDGWALTRKIGEETEKQEK